MSSKVLQYNTPYESRKYGYVKGDKQGVFFKVDFKEGKFYNTEDGYVLMADVMGFMGVVRSYKPEEAIVMPGWTQITYFSRDYELWHKKEKKEISPTLHEKTLCSHLAITISEDKYYSGSITLLPDDQFTDKPDDVVIDLINKNCQLIEIEPSGNLIPYEASKANGGYKKNNGNYNSKLSLEDKVKALKKELILSIKDDKCNEEMSLIDLVDQLVGESEDDNTLAVYVDLVKSCLN